ncbi:khg/kdpg family aldolase/carbohydrate kinase, pfkb family [Treponema primitia ZAS-2]|uniref:2-dehydro-3-deoxy-phosphogluconate aldolase n=1 Tax=Treponema primitia (strain ATCC BAA-887 / DSM 12427 / ZAS-2) TaxID=545694 RepID=F5YKQ4_TREPZ|nr:bifunctional 4-hydroxy-2-oxoglutarate aldolase/2-dehydro-3-deoxy-phosphogluconate aldolase [Treponema primitia]AEF85750.1 khg/kdpg family aldolase/carbohydrate kinase, pfkb family [Treponema primitia ZAS-2]
MEKIIEELGKIGIVPVIKIDDVEKSVPLAKALIAGGIPCAEVTFRTAEGEEAIRRINAEVPDILLGAGTVLSTDQVDRAINAGAKFIVSPGFNPKVVAYCIKKGIPIVPGCSNPSDIEQALEFGLDVIKFFPAEQSGGLEYIKAIAAPYTQLRFMPTGGINQNNIAKYTGYERIVACGGSWMVGADLINTGDFDRITQLCKEAVQAVLGFSVAHFGINTKNAETALKAANLFSALFGFTLKDGNSSIFASDNIEIMKETGLGANGHIGIGTNSLLRAIAWFERQGIKFNPGSAKKDNKGNITVIYLEEEIAGFAVHLVQRKSTTSP